MISASISRFFASRRPSLMHEQQLTSASASLPSRQFTFQEILSHPSTYEITVASRLFESYNRNVAYNLGRIGAQHQQQQQAAPSSSVEAEEKQTRLA